MTKALTNLGYTKFYIRAPLAASTLISLKYHFMHSSTFPLQAEDFIHFIEFYLTGPELLLEPNVIELIKFMARHGIEPVFILIKIPKQYGTYYYFLKNSIEYFKKIQKFNNIFKEYEVELMFVHVVDKLIEHDYLKFILVRNSARNHFLNELFFRLVKAGMKRVTLKSIEEVSTLFVKRMLETEDTLKIIVTKLKQKITIEEVSSLESNKVKEYLFEKISEILRELKIKQKAHSVIKKLKVYFNKNITKTFLLNLLKSSD